MSNLLNISSSPHVRDKSSTRSIMWDVIFALIPTCIFGIYNFGIRAAVLIAVCIETCLLSEYIWLKCMKLPLTVNDGSAVLTGLLLALNLTPTFPIWMAILGSIFAIIIVKQLFGGLGQNFMNPALGARCILMVSFAAVTSSVSVMESIVSNIIDRFHVSRKKGTVLVTIYACIVGVIVCLGYNVLYFVLILPNGAVAQILDLMDYLSNNLLMPTVALLSCILIGWVVKPQTIIDEVTIGGYKFVRKKLYIVMVKFVAPVLLAALLLQSLGVFSL